MPAYYLDTSAIVKRYRLRETGANVIEELLDNPVPGDIFYFSFFATLEFKAVIARQVALRSHRNEAFTRFNRDLLNLFLVWPLNQNLLDQALVVIEQNSLRAGDAIHLATGMQIASIDSNSQTFMVSSDKELLDASASAGVSTLNPLASDSLDRLRQIRSPNR
jgi:hypothetical protein